MTTPRKPTNRTRLSRRIMRDMLKPVGPDKAECVALPPVIGALEAGPLRQQLLRLRGRAVDLDGSEVVRVGGLGLQVLLSAQATWREDGQRLRLVASSEGLLKYLAIMGATDTLSHTTGVDR